MWPAVEVTAGCRWMQKSLLLLVIAASSSQSHWASPPHGAVVPAVRFLEDHAQGGWLRLQEFGLLAFALERNYHFQQFFSTVWLSGVEH